MKRLLFIWPIFLAFALWGAGLASAQEGVTAELHVAEDGYTVGDPIPLALVVTHPAGYQVIAPEIPQQWGDFIVQSQASPVTAANDDGTAATTIAIDARLFAPGAFSTPPLPVTVTDGAGQLFEVTAAPAPVVIQSVLVEGDTELRDIKPQAPLPYANWLPWMAAGLLLVLAAGGTTFWWRRRQARLALAAVDNRLPHEVALDELQRIAQMGLPQQGLYKEHYSLISDTVRRYLERAYQVPMIERTTGEVRSSLRATPISPQVADQIVTFLEESDLVKFSKFRPTAADAYGLLEDAQAIVKATMPLVVVAAVQDPTNGQDNGGPGKKAPAVSPAFSANGREQATEVHP